jgi:hypothetical protein
LREKILAIFEALLPESKVLLDVETLLLESNGAVKLESGDVVVPGNAAHSIYFRRLQAGAAETWGQFANGMAAVVAVGGIERDVYAVEPKFCFCRLVYDHGGSLISSEFIDLANF